MGGGGEGPLGWPRVEDSLPLMEDSEDGFVQLPWVLGGLAMDSGA